MRFAVESWSPDYGSPVADDALTPGKADVDASVEVPVTEWSPRRAPAGTEPLTEVLFVDGVRRVEAHVWITADDGEVHQGICASYAAGAVRCNGTAELIEPWVERGLFSPVPAASPIRTRHATFGVHVAGGEDPSGLSLRLQRSMGELEARVAKVAGAAGLVIADGPLRADLDGAPRAGGPLTVGYVKTHHSAYGPAVVGEVITRLGAGERTPLLRVAGIRPRFTWYQRLPCPQRHGWAGIVRLEVGDDRDVAAAAALADRLTLSLGRYASAESKDPRAPQNLYPVGGLERELRRRLGDPALLFRALREAAAT